MCSNPLNNKINFINILGASRKVLFYFIEECNKKYRTGDDLNFYREIINLQRKANDLNELINNENFYKKIYDTLEKWNMNQRAAKLTDLDSLQKSIIAYRTDLVELHKYKLYFLQSITDELGHKIIELLSHVFCNLKVMETKRRLVGVSKTLHFLIPDLVMPIDGKYTMRCLYGYNRNAESPEKEFKIFKDIFIKYFQIARKLDLTQNDVDGEKWNTSVPKLIDNACIGFLNYLDDKGAEDTISLIKKLIK